MQGLFVVLKLLVLADLQCDEVFAFPARDQHQTTARRLPFGALFTRHGLREFRSPA